MIRLSVAQSTAVVSRLAAAIVAAAPAAQSSGAAGAPPAGAKPQTPPVTGSAPSGTVSPPRTPVTAKPGVPAGVTPPAGYVIGPDDVLTVVFWGEKDMSAEVAVRPDGKISLPLINDIDAAGLTPDQLMANVAAAAAKYLENPAVTVGVKQINSRKVFISGEVAKPGGYPLTGPTTVLQLIALAGGLSEFADTKNIVVMRTENGRPMGYKFNYKDVLRRRNLKQNIELKPGDTVVVP